SSVLPEKTICKSAQVQIGIPPGSGNVNYEWLYHPSLNELFVPNPYASPDSTTTYTLLIRNGQCTDTVRQTVVVFSDAISVDATVAQCPGDSVRLTARNTQPGQLLSYEWFPPSLILSGQGTANPLVSPPRDTTFRVSVKNQLGCVYEADVFVDVVSKLPSLNAYSQPYTIGYGDTAQLAFTGEGVARFEWKYDSTLSSINIPDPKAFPLQTTIYTLFAEDSNGCTVSDTTVVYVFRTPCKQGGVYLPNAFTPNGDGKNDILVVRSLSITELYFAVYDRWGQLVFETRNPQQGWDGSYGGKPLDSGVFGYYLKARCDNGEFIEKKGNVTLLK
ncbi:MAG: gliding motility-associated C-terminal domain-containing protein, partial [Chitinophagales bacterium]|nr:gliding motility-associated C-terminal domain-containing protein [Chitinophagales bacterium]